MHELGPFITVVSWSRWVFLVSQDTPSGDAIRQAVLKLLRVTPCHFLHLITGYGVASLCGVISAHHISVRIHVCHDIAADTLWEGHPKFLTLFDFFFVLCVFCVIFEPPPTTQDHRFRATTEDFFKTVRRGIPPSVLYHKRAIFVCPWCFVIDIPVSLFVNPSSPPKNCLPPI